MVTISKTSTQTQTIALLQLLPIIGARTLGMAIERRRWPFE